MRSIDIGTYVGDGAVTLSDWSVATATLGSVSYTFPGQTGTAYNFDVTAPLQTAMTGGASFFGAKFTGTTNGGISNVTPLVPRRLDVVLTTNPAPVSDAEDYFSFTAQPNDWVGRGLTQTHTPATGVFTVSRNFDNGISVRAGDWDIRFSAPGDLPLAVGSYENATRWPFQDANTPGLDFSGVERGNNESLGRFDLLEVSYGPGGEVLRFVAEFENRGILGGSMTSAGSATPSRNPRGWWLSRCAALLRCVADADDSYAQARKGLTAIRQIRKKIAYG